ncbi:NitT/TauT family transport system substrate-binding protein [Propionibacterium cyclohexanicum]|uniref:NitT/TauT family transport system substrate-binding protein n=1 Tax=Propionibacterium cyclohexanicum TaxID=64702 RepID=A0A1H9TDP5_9ACTN|nr:ABC transporter substrate-binding protein [Propionibacterium cyclohexanicum]SER95084.1 NitT/TauT family transport system substrate-binding protein [Propionibacterium cyclohexanicum]
MSTSSGTPPTPKTGDLLPSGAVVQATSTGQETRANRSLSRRGFLTGLGLAAAGGLIVGGTAGGLIGHGLGAKQASAAGAKNRTLSLIYGGDVCDAPAIVAKEKGFFEQAGLNVTLHKSVGDEDIKAAVGSGTYDASSGIFYSWLKPVEQGQNVKFVAGLHSGCLRLVVPNNGSITQLSQLKNRKIGIPSLQSSATMFFSMDLLDAGINPLPDAGQVSWKVLDSSLLADALKNGQVDAIATSDPIAYEPLLKGYGKELASNMTGTNAQQFCCCTALNGDLVSKEPDLARKLITAWADGSRYVAGHEEEVAHLEVDKKYVAGDVETVTTLLKSYAWKPSVVNLKSSLLPGIKKFQQTGYLDPGANPDELADKAFTTLGLTW